MNYKKFKVKFIKGLDQTTLKEHIRCILMYGSQDRKDDVYSKSDVDIHILLKRSCEPLLSELKNYLNNFNNLDVGIIFEDELKIPFSFQNGSQGDYFLYVFACADCVFGHNPYPKAMSRLPRNRVKDSLMFRIKENLWRVREMYLNSSLTKVVLRKHVARLFLNVLLVTEKIKLSKMAFYNYKQSIKLFKNSFPELISKKETSLLSRVANLSIIYKSDYLNILNILSRVVFYMDKKVTYN